MSIFPHIAHQNELLSKVSDKEEIRSMSGNYGTSIVCYMVSTPTTFDNQWSRECRGIAFNAEGQVISRPLHKFFNVGEKESTQVQAIDWSSIVRVMDKRDGSMLTSALIDGKIKLKSKKSFTSDVAIASQKWLEAHKNYLALCEHLAHGGYTAIFEWTSPAARIVLAYGESKLTLLHVRENESGRYLTLPELQKLKRKFDIELVDEYQTQFDIKDYLARAETEEGIEGWIFQSDTGEMYKLKTKWYIERHRCMTGLRTRDIVGMVLDESIDDIKAKLVSEGLDISQIEKIEQDVLLRIREIIRKTDELAAQAKDMDRKTAALTFRQHELFGLMIKVYSGSTPDYKEYFRKNFLTDYDLQLIQFSDSIAEAD